MGSESGKNSFGSTTLAKATVFFLLIGKQNGLPALLPVLLISGPLILRQYGLHHTALQLKE
jgi:hypothetical protein